MANTEKRSNKFCRFTIGAVLGKCEFHLCKFLFPGQLSTAVNDLCILCLIDWIKALEKLYKKKCFQLR